MNARDFSGHPAPHLLPERCDANQRTPRCVGGQPGEGVMVTDPAPALLKRRTPVPKGFNYPPTPKAKSPPTPPPPWYYSSDSPDRDFWPDPSAEKPVLPAALDPDPATN